MKRLKNNPVLSLFVSMLFRLYQENRERVTWERALATVSCCLRAVPVWNLEWREGLFSLCEWFLFLPSSCNDHEGSRHPTSCHACVCSKRTSGRALRSCSSLLLKRPFWWEGLSQDGRVIQQRENSCRARTCLPGSLQWWADTSNHWICKECKLVYT